MNQVISYTIFFKKRLRPQPVALHLVRKILQSFSHLFITKHQPGATGHPPSANHNFASGSPSTSLKSSSVAPPARPSPNCAFFSGLGFPQNHRVDYQERFFFMTFFWGWGWYFFPIYYIVVYLQGSSPKHPKRCNNTARFVSHPADFRQCPPVE